MSEKMLKRITLRRDHKYASDQADISLRSKKHAYRLRGDLNASTSLECGIHTVGTTLQSYDVRLKFVFQQSTTNANAYAITYKTTVSSGYYEVRYNVRSLSYPLSFDVLIDSEMLERIAALEKERNHYVKGWWDGKHKMNVSLQNSAPQTQFSGSETIAECSLYELLLNSLPVISGSDQSIGAKNEEFSVSYRVSDSDAANQLTITETLNGQTLRRLNNAPRGTEQTITINREKLYALEVGRTNTIEVKVDDGAGGVAYRRWTFTRTNSAPVVSGSDSDLGVKTQEFSVNFSATDQENDPMTAIAYLDEKVLKNFGTINSGEEYTITFDKLGFSKIKHGEVHKLRIEVRDRNNATSVRNYTFTRALDRLSYTFKKETDKKVTKAFVTPTWFVADGAVAKVEVSNNAKDEAPVWENMTTQVLEGRHFNLQNATKTSDQWMFGVRISIERGQAKENSWLGGFGGGY